MDIISLQEAKRAQRWVGPLLDLRTKSKGSIVEAINELYGITTKWGLNQTKAFDINEPLGKTVFWLDFVENATIKGIKFSPDEPLLNSTDHYRLSLLTDNEENNGKYVYDSGKIYNILWDIMDIPFVSENTQHRLYGVFELQGSTARIKGKLEIYYMERSE